MRESNPTPRDEVEFCVLCEALTLTLEDGGAALMSIVPRAIATNHELLEKAKDKAFEKATKAAKAKIKEHEQEAPRL